jgi:hypothetical protein
MRTCAIEPVTCKTAELLLKGQAWHPRFGYGRAWRVPGVTDPTAGSGRDTRTSTRTLAVGNLISQAIRRTPRL